MRFDILFSALLVAPLSLAAPLSAGDTRLTHARRQSTCDASVISAIKAARPHPRIFCTNWPSKDQSVSPISGLTPPQITNACVCILATPVSSKSSSKTSTASTSAVPSTRSSSTTSSSGTGNKPAASSNTGTNTATVFTTANPSAISSASSVASAVSVAASSVASSLSASLANVTFSQVGVLSTPTATATAVAKPCVAGITTDSEGNSWTVQCDRFFEGTLAGKFYSPDLATCQSTCTGVCAGVVYNPKTQVCRKYSTIDSSFARPPFIAVTLVNSAVTNSTGSLNGTISTNGTMSINGTMSGNDTVSGNSSLPVQLPAITTNGINTELLVNGGFSDGDIIPWIAQITTNMNLEVTDGAGPNEPALFSHFHVQGSNRAQMVLSQAVQMYENDTFHWTSTAYFGYGTGLPSTVSCDAAWFINGTYYQITNFNSTSGTSYNFVIDGLTTASGIATVSMYVGCSSKGASVDFPIAIDDVSLIANWVDSRADVYGGTVDKRFVQFYSGTGMIQNNATNDDAAVSTSMLTVGDQSAAVQSCADRATYAGLNAFDVHYMTATKKWACVLYPMMWQSPSLFSVANAGVGASLGYFHHELDPTEW